MRGLMLLVLAPLLCLARTDVYRIEMRFNVPAVVDNTESLGSRTYRQQRVVGTMRVVHGEEEPRLEPFLTNRSHRVGKTFVTYDTMAYGTGWHAIGSNRTGVFRRASVFTSIEATPSYALADGEDNTLILTLAGRGSTDRLVTGYASGQLGCGCQAYGHVSPTRIYGTDLVVDTAAVWGTWTARKLRTEE